MPQELVLTTSSIEDSSILIHDLHTSNHIQSFRQSTSAKNGVIITPSKTHFLAAQQEKGLIHVYSWGKDSVTMKMVPPEKIRSLRISPSGAWCLGGSESGKLFLWEAFLISCPRLTLDGEWKSPVCARSTLSTSDTDMFWIG